MKDKLNLALIIGIFCLMGCGKSCKYSQQNPDQEITKENTDPEETAGKQTLHKGYSGYFLSDVVPQKFTIYADRDTILTGVGGVRIVIQKNSFTDAEGMPVNGKIDIKLKEYLTSGSMILAGLTTQMNNGQLLRTGGMIDISAYTDAGEVQLSGEKPIRLLFPKNNSTMPTMRPFLGKRQADGSVTWDVTSRKRIQRVNLKDTGDLIVWDPLPRCIDCLRKMKKILNTEYREYFPDKESSFFVEADIETNGIISYLNLPDNIPPGLLNGIYNAFDSIQPVFAARSGKKTGKYTANFIFDFKMNKRKMELTVSASDVIEYPYYVFEDLMNQGVFTPYERTKINGSDTVILIEDDTNKRDNKRNYIHNSEYYLRDRILHDSIIYVNFKLIEKSNYSPISTYILGLNNSDVLAKFSKKDLFSFKVADIYKELKVILYIPKLRIIISGKPVYSINSQTIQFDPVPKYTPVIMICYAPVHPDSNKYSTPWLYSETNINSGNVNSVKPDLKEISFSELEKKLLKLK